MQIRIDSLTPTTPAEGWRETAERRVRFVLRRLRGKVQQVHVRLRDLNGARGGPDQVCQVSIVTDGQGTLVASAVAAHPRQALDAALQGVTATLVSRFKRRRQATRPAPRAWRAAATA
ncbi:MAG TPA: HPF/RaiA family ribosome-associated protein [Hydrogenophaga sp.]|uniref:HPF/RaiA family ribosome-associated protein n=1 Tax=Hydrogenophaga sp. TaxID=1904254 RepID=UPI002CF7929E|nr:HPF/RaiA family ribosome-associated protein [Hydrogenophaga sp.]HMN94260.1 HPF/RaiA family ribosome-associated protein [Hydrogenophaga sp.]HMP11028.1 HPF/RaiA family ribosome-associated protein [Hydrogenophaga sp.]